MATKKKILIVDDEPQLLEILETYFTKSGFKVELASDGGEALRRARKFKPNIIILDILMPKIDGITVLKNLKTNPKTKKIPVVIFTNFKSQEKMDEVKKKWNTLYLLKAHCNLDDLYKEICKELGAGAK